MTDLILTADMTALLSTMTPAQVAKTTAMWAQWQGQGILPDPEPTPARVAKDEAQNGRFGRRQTIKGLRRKAV